MKCYYCKNYRKGKKAEIEGKVNHLCPILKKYVKGNDKKCESFDVVDYFWCDRDRNYILRTVCINRMNTGKCSKRCKQGKEIINISRGVRR